MDESQAGLLSERFLKREDYLELQETLVYNGNPPTGGLTFHLSISVENQAGPWNLIWSPPSP